MGWKSSFTSAKSTNVKNMYQSPREIELSKYSLNRNIQIVVCQYYPNTAFDLMA